MITDLGPTRFVVNPGDKVWFQGRSRGAETYKATPTFLDQILIYNIRYIQFSYTNHIWGLELRAT